MTPTTLVLESSPSPAAFASQVTLTAMVSPAAATGVITFLDSGVALGTGTLGSGTAPFATSALSTAPHYLTATYGGDANYYHSASTTVIQQVNPPQTQIGLATVTSAELQANDPSLLNRTINLIAQQTYAAQNPGSTGNLTGVPQITASDLSGNDPSRLNRTLQLVATQIQVTQGSSVANGLPQVTQSDLENSDPTTINRILQLLAGQVRLLK